MGPEHGLSMRIRIEFCTKCPTSHEKDRAERSCVEETATAATAAGEKSVRMQPTGDVKSNGKQRIENQAGQLPASRGRSRAILASPYSGGLAARPPRTRISRQSSVVSRSWSVGRPAAKRSHGETGPSSPLATMSSEPPSTDGRSELCAIGVKKTPLQ